MSLNITHSLPQSENIIINNENKRLFCTFERGNARWKLNRLPVVSGESRVPGRLWDCSVPDRRSEGTPRYTNAPMIVFVPEGIVLATGGCFVIFWGFFVNNTCQAGLPVGQFWHGSTVW